MNKKKDFSAALLGVVVALILWVTILNRESLNGTPIIYPPFHAFLAFLKDLKKGRFGANFFGNIVLFIPVGFLLPFVMERNRLWKTVAMGSGLSFLIETTQFITSRGCFDLDDVLLNTLGTMIGYFVLRMVCTLLKKKSSNTSCLLD